MASAKERFNYLAESWFFSEPIFFAVYCNMAQTPDTKLKCAVRVGKGRLEYNPELIEAMPDEVFEETIKIEMIRLLLKHPYERTPVECSRLKMRIASDMTLSSHYQFRHNTLTHPNEFGLPAGKHYEWYLSNIKVENIRHQQNGSNSDGDSSQNDSQNNNEQGYSNGEYGFPDEALAESAGLWEEDECNCIEINDIIENVLDNNKNWGSIPGNVAGLIIASAQVRIDYRKVLSGFRASVLSSRRYLTRMKPNRRSGFDHMGSKRDFSTRLLIAVDTSGSVTDVMLSRFFSIIIRFFKYGIETIDVIQFDTEIKGSVLSLEKVSKNTKFEINGRGGTDFQCVFDYAAQHQEYDGLIILTDGYAPEPKAKKHDKIRKVWVCDCEESYKEHYCRMRKTGRVCFMNLK